MSVFFTRDLLILSGGDPNEDFELNVDGNRRVEKLVTIDVPSGQFITGATITPIQNIPNYAKTIRRLVVDRAYEGNVVKISVRGTRHDTRFRSRLSVGISTFASTNDLGTASGAGATDLKKQAFQLWANATGSNGFGTLPPANKANVGNVFFFKTVGANTVEISTSRAQDKILHGANYGNESDAITSDATDGRTVVIRCLKRRIWVLECVNVAAGWGL